VADTRVLLQGLEEYHSTLRRHLIEVRTEFAQVERQWQVFSSVYESDAADQFRAKWLRTVQRFEEYIQRSENISRVLEERIDYLRELNAPDSSLG
jgi:hypothetical protein